MSAFVRAVIALSAGVALSPPELAPTDVPLARASSAREVPGGLSTEGGVLTLVTPGTAMIRVPHSVFTMGSSAEDVLAALVDCQSEPGGHQCKPSLFADETPERLLTLSSYWLDRTEVTVADYARCVAVRRCRPLPFDQGAARFDRPLYPASLVTWDEARGYCAFRGGRLPTEAEFERAARGPSRRRFPWGDLSNSHVTNHGRLAADPTAKEDGFAELAPVGSFPEGRTPDGFVDLAGNVAEWMHDRYATEYVPTDLVDPQGPEPPLGLTARVVRGGSFSSGMAWVRGAARGAAEPSTRRPSIGFRCARDAERRQP